MRVWLLTAVLILWGMTPLTAKAQPDCENPFAGIELRFSNGFWPKTDFCQHSVAYDEIISGGPPPNAIPPIGFPAQDQLDMPELSGPTFESAAEAGEWLQDGSPVIALEIDGDARAYPLSILIWHEIVNDTVGGVPVTITFCPLCNSSIVFERQIGEEVLWFGTTGNLRNSDLIMWDDRTQSWWQQFTGEAIVGAYTGTLLTIRPSQVVGFGQFKTRYPQGQVLQPVAEGLRPYGQNPYIGYDAGDPFLFEGELDRRLPPTARVLAGQIGAEAVAYPFTFLSTRYVYNDVVGGQPVVAFWQPGAFSALDAYWIDESRDVGMAGLFSRELNGDELTFRAENGVIVDDQTGSQWDVFGNAVSGALAGQQLRLLPAAPHFWFAWIAFRPDSRLVRR